MKSESPFEAVLGKEAAEISRRRFISLAGISSFGMLLVACGSDADDATDGGSTESVDSTDAEPDTTTSDDEETADSSEGGATGWANGGTDLISVAYPSDDIFAAAGTCEVALSAATTLGPCYFADETGEDISEGLAGLPMQLCLRVIDADCNPIEGQRVEVWHCDTEGVYSGDTSESSAASEFAGDFCTGGDDDAASSSWYRGQLSSDSNGRVNFKSCFPGWYRGRTLHIHFAVSDDSGTRVISQLCFPDELASEVYTTHPAYSSRGDQDTPLASGTDTVFPADFTPYLLTTERNTDGTLLAYHTIQVS